MGSFEFGRDLKHVLNAGAALPALYLAEIGPVNAYRG